MRGEGVAVGCRQPLQPEQLADILFSFLRLIGVPCPALDHLGPDRLIPQGVSGFPGGVLSRPDLAGFRDRQLVLCLVTEIDVNRLDLAGAAFGRFSVDAEFRRADAHAAVVGDADRHLVPAAGGGDGVRQGRAVDVHADGLRVFEAVQRSFVLPLLRQHIVSVAALFRAVCRLVKEEDGFGEFFLVFRFDHGHGEGRRDCAGAGIVLAEPDAPDLPVVFLALFLSVFRGGFDPPQQAVAQHLVVMQHRIRQRHIHVVERKSLDKGLPVPLAVGAVLTDVDDRLLQPGLAGFAFRHQVEQNVVGLVKNLSSFESALDQDVLQHVVPVLRKLQKPSFLAGIRLSVVIDIFLCMDHQAPFFVLVLSDPVPVLR